jgi:hypothetical protein
MIARSYSNNGTSAIDAFMASLPVAAKAEVLRRGEDILYFP